MLGCETHYHLHNEKGLCYGDVAHFDTAVQVATEYMYPGCVSDNDPVERILVVIDAPFCIQECNEE